MELDESLLSLDMFSRAAAVAELDLGMAGDCPGGCLYCCCCFCCSFFFALADLRRFDFFSVELGTPKSIMAAMLEWVMPGEPPSVIPGPPTIPRTLLASCSPPVCELEDGKTTRWLSID